MANPSLQSSAKFLAELKRLIPNIPDRCVELQIKLADGLVTLKASFYAEEPTDWTTSEPTTKTFWLTDEPPAGTNPGLSTAHPQPGPSA